MIIIGLTGSIGMGKSTAAAEFERLGARIFDADKEVHKLLGKGGGAAERIKKEFPESLKSEGIDRKELGKIVYGDKKKLKKLESIIHPMVRAAEKHFLQKCVAAKVPLVVMDIPLLFETGFERFCDYVVVIHAPSFIQEQRVIKRPDMNREKFSTIKKRQQEDEKKMKQADFIIYSGLEKAFTVAQVRRIYSFIKNGTPGKKRKNIGS